MPQDTDGSQDKGEIPSNSKTIQNNIGIAADNVSADQVNINMTQSETQPNATAVNVGMIVSDAHIGQFNYHVPPVLKELTCDVIFKVPPPINPFYGRNEFLTRLHQELVGGDKLNDEPDDGESRSIFSNFRILCGLGGVGKTSTVAKYISKYKSNYRHIIWIDAQNEQTMANSFHQLAQQKFGWLLPDRNEKMTIENVLKILPEIYEKLCKDLCLIIFDNAEQYEDRSDNTDDADYIKNGIHPFFPQQLSSQHKYPVVVATSRNEKWGSPVTFTEIHLDYFNDQESIEFILHQLQLDPNSTSNISDAHELASLLGGLPLALQQAVAYIRNQRDTSKFGKSRGYTIQNYISAFLEEFERLQLVKYLPDAPCTGNISVYTTWVMTFKKIEENGYKGVMAMDLVDYLSLFPSCSISSDFIHYAYHSTQVQGGIETLREALSLLEKYSIISIEKEESGDSNEESSLPLFIHIHRVIQTVVIESFRIREKAQGYYIDMRKRLKDVMELSEDTRDLNPDQYLKSGQRGFGKLMDTLGLDSLSSDNIGSLKELFKTHLPQVYGALENIIEPKEGTQRTSSMGTRQNNFAQLLGALTTELQGGSSDGFLRALAPTGIVKHSELWDPNKVGTDASVKGDIEPGEDKLD